MTVADYLAVLGGFTGIIIVLLVGINLGSNFVTDKKLRKLKEQHDEEHKSERQKLISDIVDFFITQQRNGRDKESSSLNELKRTMGEYKSSNFGFTMKSRDEEDEE